MIMNTMNHLLSFDAQVNRWCRNPGLPMFLLAEGNFFKRAKLRRHRVKNYMEVANFHDSVNS